MCISMIAWYFLRLLRRLYTSWQLTAWIVEPSIYYRLSEQMKQSLQQYSELSEEARGDR